MADQHATPNARQREVYTLRDNPTFDATMTARTAAREAAFFLLHLRPGMRLLDVGCGPGSITLGLAEAVAPGEVVGVDLRPEVVEQARAAAAQRGIANVRFEVGSAYDLPFPDASFDAAFAHIVLMHLREPARALAEMRRVLRPGGLVGVRDVDLGARLIYPLTPLLEQLLAMGNRVRRHNGGDIFLGRTHRRLLRDAGFARTEAGATMNCAGTLEGTRHAAAFRRVQLPSMVQTALHEGWVDQATADAMATELDAWAEGPDAFSVETTCHAVGWVGA
jgi:SAM-dependent methyltransferase